MILAQVHALAGVHAASCTLLSPFLCRGHGHQAASASDGPNCTAFRLQKRMQALAKDSLWSVLPGEIPLLPKLKRRMF